MRAAAGGVQGSWGAGATAFWTFCFGRTEQAPAVTASGTASQRRARLTLPSASHPGGRRT